MPRALILLTSLVRSRQRIAFALIGLAACVAVSASAQTAHLSSATTQNFGSINIGTPSTPATLTFTFDTAGVLGSTSVVTKGVTGLDFTDAGGGSCMAGTSYAAAATCTVEVTFQPRLAGVRYGAALLLDDTGSPIATAYLQGTGVGPQLTFLPGIETTAIDPTLCNSAYPVTSAAPTSIALDGGGNFYLGCLLSSFDAATEEFQGSGVLVKATPTANGTVQSAIYPPWVRLSRSLSTARDQFSRLKRVSAGWTS
jgi:hypothetical protein